MEYRIKKDLFSRKYPEIPCVLCGDGRGSIWCEYSDLGWDYFSPFFIWDTPINELRGNERMSAFRKWCITKRELFKREVQEDKSDIDRSWLSDNNHLIWKGDSWFGVFGILI